MKNLITRSIITALIFTIIGLIIVYFGIVEIVYRQNKKNYPGVEATVIERQYPTSSRDEAYLTVEYEVDGKKYSIKTSETITNPAPVGSKLIIKYNPANPEKVLINDSHYGVVGVFIGGLMFIFGGLITLYRGMSIKKGLKNLKYDQTNINQVVSPKQK